MNNKKYLDIIFLKNNHTMIHAFGLGFIQIKLTDNIRIHFYSNKVTLTPSDEEVHNHRYNFKSTVLKGNLVNKIYSVSKEKNGNFILENESCNPNVDKKNHNKSLVSKPKLITQFSTSKGESYYIDKDTYHQVKALDGTVTLLEREPIEKEFAQIVYEKKICPFSVNLNEKVLWEIVEEIIRR